MKATNTPWTPPVALTRTHSPLGHAFEHPAHWKLLRQDASIWCTARELPFAPLRVHTAQCKENSLATLSNRMRSALEQNTACSITEARLLTLPRPAMMFNTVQSSSKHAAVRAVHVAELLDDGRLCLSVVSQDWAAGQTPLETLLAPWRTMRPPTPQGSDLRGVTLEGAGYALGVPQDWVLHMCTDARVEARSATRDAKHPNLVVTLDPAAAQADAPDPVRATPIGLGGRPALCTSHTAINAAGHVDRVNHVSMPGTGPHLTFQGLDSRWAEYAQQFEAICKSFRWA